MVDASNDLLREWSVAWKSPTGNLVLWFLPFTTMKADQVSSEVSALRPGDQANVASNIFINITAFMTGAESSGDLQPVEKVFYWLWTHRDEPLADRLTMFEQLYSNELLHVFSVVYADTRDKTFSGPDVLREVPKADADPLQRSTTKKKRSAS